MQRTAKPRFAVVFLMTLAVCLSLGLPAEDILDAVYDASEAVPYEVTPLFSIAVQPAVARTTQPVQRSLHLKSIAPSLFPLARLRDTAASRSTDARGSLALLCTRLC